MKVQAWETRLNDSDTTLLTLKDAVAGFVNDREWQRFHTPKNLAISVAIEAAELMEHFQWISEETSQDRVNDTRYRADIADEISDVASYLFALANVMRLDLTTAILGKLEKNAKKYPVEAFRGRYGSGDPAPVTPAKGKPDKGD